MTRGGGDPGPEVPQLLPATLWGPLQAPRTSHGCWLWGCLGWARGLSRDGSGVVLASFPQSRTPLTRQTGLPCLLGSRMQGTQGPPGFGTAGVAQTSLPCWPAPPQAEHLPRTEIAGGKGAEGEVWRTVCRK